MNKKNEKISRRKFLARTAAGITTFSFLGFLPSCPLSFDLLDKLKIMPKRTLGKTDLDVSLLAFGGGSQFLRNEDGEWQQMMERAIAFGVNLFDTASTYQWSNPVSSEERFGQILPRFRGRVFISTKIESRNAFEAAREFERSLRRLKTDYVDILLIHSIEADEDLAAIENGVYNLMTRLKDQGAAKFIGFSSMNSAQKSKELMERLDFDVVILAINPTKYGDFAQVALPVARKKNIGVIAMKVMRDVVGQSATPKELLHYAWAQPGVASAVVGHYELKTLQENIRIAQAYGEGGESFLDLKDLETRLAHLASPETLCWARPDYRDGMMVGKV